MEQQHFNPVPDPGTMQQEVAFQAVKDFDVLCNIDPTRGELRERPGWRALRYVSAWSLDGSGFSVPSTYRHLSFENTKPMGSYVYSGQDGQDYVLSVVKSYAATASPEFVVRTITCQLANQVNVRAEGTSSVNGLIQGTAMVSDNLGNENEGTNPYVFAELGQWVYFTNGGEIWRWSHKVSGDNGGSGLERVSRKFSHWPGDQANAFSYFTEIRGAKLVAEHNGHLVLGGFEESSATMDVPVDVNADGVIDTKDVKNGQLTVSPDGFHARIPANYLLFSHAGQPENIPYLHTLQIPSSREVSAVASFNKQLIIWTPNEMYIMQGAVGLKRLTKLSSGIGCVSQRTVSQTPDGLIIWLAEDGIYAWNGSGRPERISKGHDRFFRGPVMASFPTTLPSSFNAQNIAVPVKIRTDQLHLASGVVIPGNDYYAVSVAGGSGHETNGIILCVSYRTGQCWYYASRHEKLDQKWVGASSPDTSNDGAVASGAYTLMVSRREPRTLLAQGVYAYNIWEQDPTDWRTHTSICALDNEWGDERVTFSSHNLVVSDTAFDAFIMTSRIFLGDSRRKRIRDLHVRLYGTHHDHFETLAYPGAVGSPYGSADANRCYMFFLPELSGFDQERQGDTNPLEWSDTFTTWPDEYISEDPQATPPTGSRRYFFQTQANENSLYNRYSSVSAINTIDFLGTEVFDKKVKLRNLQSTTQFARFGFWKAITRGEGAVMRILSIGVDVQVMFGERS